MKAYGGMDVYIHIFLTSAEVGGEWSVSRHCCFTPWERAPITLSIGGWVEPRAGLNDTESEKLWPYRDSNLDTLVVQPVASRFTRCAH
jgi:hypothetical protein